MSDELISVIVPVYNVEQYLETCIDSIQKQTYSHLEIILVDDGSRDRSGDICDNLAMRDPRIKVIHKENGGLASARNAGIKEAQGDYLGFVDSDDWIKSNMYEDLLNGILVSGADIAVSGRVLYYGVHYKKNLYTLKTVEVWKPKEAIARLLAWDGIDSSACDKLYKKDIFTNIKFPENRLHEDIFVMYKILGNVNKIIHIGDFKYFYRQRTGGITRTAYSHKKMDLLDAITEMESIILRKYPDLKEQLYAFCIVNVDIIIYQFRQSKRNKKKYKNDYERIEACFRKYGTKCLQNKYLSNREKLKYIFVKLGLTNIYIRLKDMYLGLKA